MRERQIDTERDYAGSKSRLGEVRRKETDERSSLLCGCQPARLKKRYLSGNAGRTCKDGQAKREREIYHSGGDGGEDPPVLIPNTEVKLTCADNTLRATAREDR